MLLRRSPQNPCYVGILAGEDGLRPTAPSALGFHVTDTNTLVPDKVTVSKKSQATRASAWERRKLAQVVADRPGAGSIPASFKISHTVEGAT